MLYSLAVRTPAAAAGAAYADLRSAAGDKLKVREIGAFCTAATASSMGLIRPNAVGTATSPQTGIPHDSNDPAGTGQVGIAWSAAPTIAGTPIYLRRFTSPALSGAGIIWTFPPGQEIEVAVSSSLILWNFGAGAGAALDAYFVWDE